MSYRAFSFSVVGAILMALGAVGLFNFIVDPFWYFRAVEITGFNRDKPRAPDNERWVKPPLAARLAPKAVIVGNSFSEIGLPPTHSGFTRQGALPGFNLSLHGGTWDDIYCLSRFAIERLHVRRLVVSVYGTDDAPCPDEAGYARLDYGRALFSRGAIDASRQTLRQQDGRPGMTAEGLWPMVRYDERMQSNDEIARNFARLMKTGICDHPAPPAPPVDPASIARPPAAASQGMGLRSLIRLARAHDVELVLLFNPTHVLFNEIARQCRGASNHWDYLWQVASIVDQEARGDERVQLWDFFAYVPLTGERVHAGVPMRDRLWQDAGHFNHEVGTQVFDAIYGGHDGFGRRVTPEDLDRLVVDAEAQRVAFLAANDWVTPELNEIVERARAMPAVPAR